MHKLTDSTRQWVIDWGPWVSVFLGSITLFSYGLLSSFPRFISQALGNQIVTQAGREFILVSVGAVFFGRVFVLVITEPLISVSRVLFLQIPLQLIRRLNRRSRMRGFRRILKTRFYIDSLLFVMLRSPNQASIFIGSLFFAYQFLDSWEVALALLIALFTIGTSYSRTQIAVKADYMLKLVHWKTKIGELESLKQMSYSTIFLAISWFSGVLYVNTLIVEAPIVEADFKLLFTGQDYSVLINRDAENLSSVLVWRLVQTEQFELVTNAKND